LSEIFWLQRSNIGRALGSFRDGQLLKIEIIRERPELRPTIKTDEYEYWPIEKQFWLKNKKLFQGIGFLPVTNINPVNGRPFMLEKY
jgi:hypothetical protein